MLFRSQRRIPAKVEWYNCRGYRDVIRGIKKMVIRGAPAIGVAAAMGLTLGARSIKTSSYAAFMKRFQEISDEMLLARPTAVNLRWAVERMSGIVKDCKDFQVNEIKDALRIESEKILDEDIKINQAMGKNGLKLVPENAVILTNCNAGDLATGGYGRSESVV